MQQDLDQEGSTTFSKNNNHLAFGTDNNNYYYSNEEEGTLKSVDSLDTIEENNNNSIDTTTIPINNNEEEDLSITNNNNTNNPTKVVYPKKQMFIISIFIIGEAVGWSILYPFLPFMVKDFLVTSPLANATITTTTTTPSLMNNYYIPSSMPTINLYSIYNNYNNNNLFNIYNNITNDNNTIINNDIHGDESQIGLYVGILAGSICLSQFLSSWLLSRLSDHFGRKIFVLFGCIVNVIFLFLFSISKSYIYALMIRIIHGLLNANIPIYKTFIIDITNSKNQEYCFLIVGVLWSFSNIISPGLGGILTDPYDKFGPLFHFDLFKYNPYLLPCLIPIILNSLSLVCCFFFLEESNKNSKLYSFWNKLNLFKKKNGKKMNKEMIQEEEELREQFDGMNEVNSKINEINEEMMEEEEKLKRDNSTSYLMEENALEISQQKEEEDDNNNNLLLLEEKERNDSISIEDNKKEDKSKEKNTILLLLTDKLVVKVVMLYLLLGLTTSSFDELLPVYLSNNNTTNYGLNFTSTNIGIILSIGGICSLIILFIYPKFSALFGSLNIYIYSSLIYTVNVILFSFSYEIKKYNLIPFSAGIYIIVTIFIFTKACVQETIYTSQILLVNNSSPSEHHIGSMTGLAHIFASFGWTLGPFISGALMNLGIYLANTSELLKDWNIKWVDKMCFFVCAFVCILNVLLAFTLPKSVANKRRY
ncbi:hypothetical protein ABK040_002270 [Willaertia magna]